MLKPFAVVAVLGSLGVSAASAATPDVVVELFTSQSCSSCPPADALLGEIKRSDPNVLVLDFHVDYWNRLGWHDPYSSAEATHRQQRYAASIKGSEVYTPQMVIGGAEQVLGSDGQSVRAAIGTALRDGARQRVSLDMSASGNLVSVNIGAGVGVGTVLLVGYDDQHVTAIGGGENSGRTLTETNVVRSITDIGRWTGAGETLTAALPAGQHAAALLQIDDSRIIAQALAAPTS